MNLLTYALTCEVCGEEGVGTLKTAAEAWDPNIRITHRDRRVCRENLARKS